MQNFRDHKYLSKITKGENKEGKSRHASTLWEVNVREAMTTSCNVTTGTATRDSITTAKLRSQKSKGSRPMGGTLTRSKGTATDTYRMQNCGRQRADQNKTSTATLREEQQYGSTCGVRAAYVRRTRRMRGTQTLHTQQ